MSRIRAIETTAVAAPAVRRLPDAGRAVYRCSLAVLVLTFVVVFAGAEVTSTNSGMAFETWPTSDGRLLWPDHPVLSQILEHGHRLVAGTLGLMAILLVVLVYQRDQRPLMRRLTIGLLVLVCVQGALGGLRVLLNAHFPVLAPILHGMLAQIICAYVGFTVMVGSHAWVPRSREDPVAVRRARRFALAAWCAVFLQAFLGLVLRHSDNAVAKWTHISFAAVAALLVLIAAGFSLGRFGSIPGFLRVNRAMLAVLGVQLVLGFVTLMTRRPKHEADTDMMGTATVASAHVVVGAGLLTLLTVLVVQCHRNLVPRVAR